MSLERELRSLEPAWPATPDVAAAVADRLERPTPAPRRAHLLHQSWPRFALAALLALVIAAVAVPPVRAELKELLGFAGGERVERVEHVPRADRRLDLGVATSLLVAERRAGFEVGVPRRLGAPDGVRLGGDLGPRAVTLLYGNDAVLTQVPDGSSVGVVKQVGGRARFVQVRIDGGRYGFWITAGPRGLLVPVALRSRVRRRTALSGASLLLWDHAGIAYRLETRRRVAEAVAIARSVPR